MLEHEIKPQHETILAQTKVIASKGVCMDTSSLQKHFMVLQQALWKGLKGWG